MTPITLGIGAAEHDDDVLVGFRLVAAGEDRGERGRAAWLDHETKPVPQHLLRPHDLLVVDEQDAIDMLLRDRKHQLSDAPRRQRVGGDAAGRCIDRPPRFQGFGQRRRAGRFDADHPLWLIREPGRDAADKAAAANGDQQRRRLRHLLTDFAPERALAEQRLDLIVGVDRQRVRLRHPALDSARASA